MIMTVVLQASYFADSGYYYPAPQHIEYHYAFYLFELNSKTRALVVAPSVGKTTKQASFNQPKKSNALWC